MALIGRDAQAQGIYNVAGRFFRADILSLPSYVAGKPSTDPNVIKVASNEMPFPTLPAVQEAIVAELSSLGRYPDASVRALTEAIAEYHQVTAEMLSVGNGSVALIERIVADIAEPGTEVIMPWRSFEAYPIAIQMPGATVVPVPLRADGACDLDSMLAAVTNKTRAVMVCTPNNPTSAALTHSELVDFLENLPGSVAVLLDEAYVDFVTAPDPVRGIELVQAYPNVMSLRTFSKAYGLAGLRVGYVVAEPSVAAAITASNTPFGVNALAQRAALAALSARSEVDERVAAIVRERDDVVTALRELGWDGPDPQANFVWFELGEDSDVFDDLCLKHGIIVRTFKGEGVRVTIAEHEASERLLQAYREWVGR